MDDYQSKHTGMVIDLCVEKIPVLETKLTKTEEDINQNKTDISSVSERVEELEKNFKHDVDLTDMVIKGQYIPLGGKSIGTVIDITTYTSSGSYNGGIFECEIGDKFIITGLGGSAPRLYGFLDSDRKLLSVASPNVQVENQELIAEENGYLIVAFQRATPYSLVKINGQSEISRIDSEITELSNEVDSIKNTA